MSFFRRVIGRWAITVVGLLSLSLLVLGVAFPSQPLEGTVWGTILATGWRILILPAYLASLAVTAAWVKVFGPGPLPGWIGVAQAFLTLAPFVALDLARRRLSDLIRPKVKDAGAQSGGTRQEMSNDG